jgi:hypothetical protein
MKLGSPRIGNGAVRANRRCSVTLDLGLVARALRCLQDNLANVMTYGWSENVEAVLRESGWVPGRAVATKAWRAQFETEGLEMHPAAELFLTEFGGLAIDVRGPGVTTARAPSNFDPRLCIGEGDRFLGWGARLGRSIYPVGDHDDGRFFLGIDEQDVLYLVGDWIGTFGRSADAIAELVEGYAPTAITEWSS